MNHLNRPKETQPECSLEEQSRTITDLRLQLLILKRKRHVAFVKGFIIGSVATALPFLLLTPSA